MVQPLLEDFMKGKSGMLAALGPSGSGKTHTVFGTLKDPGIVPITLRRIFKKSDESSSGPLRYCLFILITNRLCSIMIHPWCINRRKTKLYEKNEFVWTTYSFVSCCSITSLYFTSGRLTCPYLKYAPNEGKGRKLMIY